MKNVHILGLSSTYPVQKMHMLHSSSFRRTEVLLLFILVFIKSAVDAYPKLNLEVDDYNLVIQKKLWRLHALANRTILVHEHIPKVGGTALSFALSSECVCTPQTRVQTSCTQCPVVHGLDGFSFNYSVSRATGWIFGMHPPLAKLFDEFSRAELPRHGLLPMYVVMLREPFARFISEGLHWAGKYQLAFDWSIWYKAKVRRNYYNLRCYCQTGKIA